jgi:hypothetical protein
MTDFPGNPINYLSFNNPPNPGNPYGFAGPDWFSMPPSYRFTIPNENFQPANTRAGCPHLQFDFIDNPEKMNQWWNPQQSVLPSMPMRNKTAYPNWSYGY